MDAPGRPSLREKWGRPGDYTAQKLVLNGFLSHLLINGFPQAIITHREVLGKQTVTVSVLKQGLIDYRLYLFQRDVLYLFALGNKLYLKASFVHGALQLF